MSEINLEEKAKAVLERHNAAADDQSAIDTEALAGQLPQADHTQNFTTGSERIAPAPIVHAGTLQGSVDSMTRKEEPDDDEPVILSGSQAKTAPITEEDETIILSGEAKKHMGAMPEDQQKAFLGQLLPELGQYKKDLIINQGLTPEEANAAVTNRVKTKAAEANSKWLGDHPDGSIVVIDKTQEPFVDFTEEERRKMQLSKAIKLVVVESHELETLPVKRSNGTINMSNIRDICGSLSHYSVPLLENGDYATFRGAQSGVLTNATIDDDDDFVAIIEKKATLLYQFFQRSTLQSRQVERINEKTKAKYMDEMTYEEFCNWYLYDDIDMGIYAIVTASGMETSESTYQCQNRDCNRVFNITYNNKTLLDLSEIPDGFKGRVDSIDKARNSKAQMEQLHADYNHSMRIKSSFSNNIFEVGSPSIADARNRVDACNSKIDRTNVVDMVMLLYLDKIYVWDEAAQAYDEIDVKLFPSEAFDVICALPQIDLELLSNYIQKNKYHPTFKIKVKCPHCGREATDILNTDGMIFLHARASLTEIQS